MAQHADAKLTDLPLTLADRPKARSVRLDRRDQPLKSATTRPASIHRAVSAAVPDRLKRRV